MATLLVHAKRKQRQGRYDSEYIYTMNQMTKTGYFKDELKIRINFYNPNKDLCYASTEISIGINKIEQLDEAIPGILNSEIQMHEWVGEARHIEYKIIGDFDKAINKFAESQKKKEMRKDYSNAVRAAKKDAALGKIKEISDFAGNKEILVYGYNHRSRFMDEYEMTSLNTVIYMLNHPEILKTKIVYSMGVAGLWNEFFGKSYCLKNRKMKATYCIARN